MSNRLTAMPIDPVPVFLARGWLAAGLYLVANHWLTASWWGARMVSGTATGQVAAGLQDVSWAGPLLLYALAAVLLLWISPGVWRVAITGPAKGACQALIIFGLALTARQVFLAFYTEPGALPQALMSPPWSDGAHYHRIALNVLEGLGLSDPADVPRLEKPLYPLVMAGFYKIFGVHPSIIRTSGAVLGAVNAVLVLLIARKFISTPASFAAAAYYAVFPFAIYLSGRIHTETLFISLQLTAILMIVTRLGLNQFWQIGIGVIMALACLTRPVLLPLPFALVLWFLLRDSNWRLGLIHWVIMIAAFVLTLSPFMIRNYQITDGKTWSVSTSGGLPFLLANNPYNKDGTWVYQKQSAKMQELMHINDIEKLSQKEIDRIYFKRGLDWIIENPSDSVWLAFKKLKNYFNFYSPTKRKKLSDRYFWVGLISYGWLIPFFLAGIILSLAKWRDFLPIYLLICLFTGLAVVFTVDTRKRSPIDPFLIIFAALAIDRLTCWSRKILKSDRLVKAEG